MSTVRLVPIPTIGQRVINLREFAGPSPETRCWFRPPAIGRKPVAPAHQSRLPQCSNATSSTNPGGEVYQDNSFFHPVRSLPPRPTADETTFRENAPPAWQASPRASLHAIDQVAPQFHATPAPTPLLPFPVVALPSEPLAHLNRRRHFAWLFEPAEHSVAQVASVVDFDSNFLADLADLANHHLSAPFPCPLPNHPPCAEYRVALLPFFRMLLEEATRCGVFLFPNHPTPTSNLPVPFLPPAWQLPHAPPSVSPQHAADSPRRLPMIADRVISTDLISTGPISTGPISTGPISTDLISTGPISTDLISTDLIYLLTLPLPPQRPFRQRARRSFWPNFQSASEVGIVCPQPDLRPANHARYLRRFPRSHWFAF